MSARNLNCVGKINLYSFLIKTLFSSVSDALPTALLSRLLMCEAKVKDCKDDWINLKTGNFKTTTSQLTQEATILLGIFFKLKDLDLYTINNSITYKEKYSKVWAIVGGSRICSFEGELKCLHVHCDGDLNIGTIIDIICQMNIYEVNVYLTLSKNQYTKICYIEYCEDIKETFIQILFALDEMKTGTFTKIPELSKGLKKNLNPDSFNLSIELCLPNSSLLRNTTVKTDYVNIFVDEAFTNLRDIEISSIKIRAMEAIKAGSLCLLIPANHVLAFVANSIFGKNQGQLSDIPVAYIMTGKGFKINTDIRYVCESVINALEQNDIKVMNISADTAFHQLLLHPWRSLASVHESRTG